jgi:hypothetical protein
MPGENQNKIFNWKNKLAGLESIPDETFGKEDAWDKLYEHLQKKKGNKKLTWYWIAASFLLFGLVITLMTHSKKDLSSRASVTPIQKEKARVNSFIKPEKNDQTETVNANLTTKNKTTNTVFYNEQTEHRMVARPIAGKIILKDTVSFFLNTEAATKFLQIQNTDSNTAIALPAKQKLKVVHINELNSPVIGSPPDMVRNTDKHSFKFINPDEEVFSSPPVSTQSHGFIVITKPFSN